MTTAPDLSIVVVNWNTRDLLANCLASIPGGAATLSYQVVVVDNGSSDGSAELVANQFPGTILLRNAENVGFARANNQGIAATQSQYVLLLNSDTVVQPGALLALVCFLDEHPRAGVVAPRLLTPDGSAQSYAFGGDPTLGYLLARGLNRLLFRRSLHNWATDRTQTADWVSGACMMVRRAAIEQVGPLDQNMFMYFEDSEWCLRIRQAGWQVYYHPQVAVVHLGGRSLAKNPAARRAYYRSLEYVYAKHYSPWSRLALRMALAPYRWLTRQ
jgi:GT2 family glycosyltransferase